MPLATPLLPPLLALLPIAATCVSLPLHRLPNAACRAVSALAAGMQIAAALFLLLLPTLEAATALPLPIWLPTCGGVLIGTSLPLLKLNTKSAPPPHSMQLQIPPAAALGALAAQLPSCAATADMLLLLATAAVIAAQYLADNLFPQMSAPYAGFMHVFPRYLPTAAAIIIAYAVSAEIPLLQVLLPSCGAGAMLCRAIAQTVPQIQQSYRANWCTLGISLGFALVLLLYSCSR